MTCAYCGKVKKLNWQGSNTPEIIAKRWRELGWDFDPWNAKCCVCPDHKRKTQAASERTTTMQSTTVTQIKPQTMRPLTSAEKSRIRRLLDEHFDDEKGRYIDQYSDQQIGKDLDIPWSAVKEIREAAYGPIREDERFDQLRKEITNLREHFAEQIAKLMAKLDDLEKSYK